MTKEQSLSQLNDLFLTGGKKEDLVICTPISTHIQPYSQFEVMSVETGDRYKITFKIEEVR